MRFASQMDAAQKIYTGPMSQRLQSNFLVFLVQVNLEGT